MAQRDLGNEILKSIPYREHMFVLYQPPNSMVNKEVFLWKIIKNEDGTKSGHILINGSDHKIVPMDKLSHSDGTCYKAGWIRDIMADGGDAYSTEWKVKKDKNGHKFVAPVENKLKYQLFIEPDPDFFKNLYCWNCTKCGNLNSIDNNPDYCGNCKAVRKV